jgi:hypothetical protein
MDRCRPPAAPLQYCAGFCAPLPKYASSCRVIVFGLAKTSTLKSADFQLFMRLLGNSSTVEQRTLTPSHLKNPYFIVVYSILGKSIFAISVSRVLQDFTL